jgi:DNA-binding FadR family transcriptional regulator
MLSLLTLDRASTRELLEARYYIEGIVAKLAAQRATQPDMSRLKEIFAAMEASAASDDVENFSCQDNAFHKELAVISQNSLFCRILETLCGLNYQFLIGFTRTAGAIGRAVSFHHRILAAVSDHDAERAQQEMNEHMKDIIRSVKRNYNLDMPLY